MMYRIQALNFRSLRCVDVSVGSFEILVGPNGSGKSSLLDVISIIGDILRAGPSRAILGDPQRGVPQRSPDPAQMLWMRQGDRFELAVEAAIPDEIRNLFRSDGYDSCRYEVAIGVSALNDKASLLAETLWLKPGRQKEPTACQAVLFPEPHPPPQNLVHPHGGKTPAGWRKVVNKVPESGNDYYFAETSGWNNPFRLGPGKSALGNLPEDEARFPAATWFKRVLMEDVRRIVLSSEALRRPSPPGLPRRLLPDGSNLPWIVAALERDHEAALKRWVDHLRTALPDLKEIKTIERPEDKHRYLVLVYDGGFEAPSWLVSDGTLRLLALTLLAYIPASSGIYLIEEPENGIHPRAVETLFKALSAVSGAQTLCASHSPLMAGLADASKIICCARGGDSAATIVRGSEHPGLNAWKGKFDRANCFASGVLA
jgi:hypothetical protein